MVLNQLYLPKMEESIKLKKSTVITSVCVIVIGLFIFFAFKGFNSKDDLNGELVQGGEVGSNTLVNEGDVQIVNLGVANYNYDPETITVQSNKKVRIVGNMQQLKGCLRAFTIPDLSIRKTFTGNDNVLEFTPDKKGTFGFSCSMGMGIGKLIVN